MIRVLVVDDSLFMREVVSQILDRDPLIKVIGTASNGKEALEKVKRLGPDVITLDINLPDMSGLDVLYEVMRTHPTPTVVVSAYTPLGSQEAVTALEYGATDIIVKPSGEISADLWKLSKSMITSVHTASFVHPQKLADNIRRVKLMPARPMPITVPKLKKIFAGEKEIIIIGASTGGPPAVELIIKSLPHNFPLPVIAIVHMPMGFTKAYADRLNKVCSISVKEAQDGETLVGEQVYIAPGGYDLNLVEYGGKAKIKLAAPSTSLSPKIDVTFTAAAKIFQDKVLGIILTGMGDDGTEGAKKLKAAGSQIIAQDEKSCVVYGMPKEVAEAGACDKVVSLAQIPKAIYSFL